MGLPHYHVDLTKLSPQERSRVIEYLDGNAWTNDPIHGHSGFVLDVFFDEGTDVGKIKFPPGTVLLKING